MSKRDEVLAVAAQLLAADPAIFNRQATEAELRTEITGCVNVAVALVDIIDEWESKRPKPIKDRPPPTSMPGSVR